jgi:hypothetical protein
MAKAVANTNHIVRVYLRGGGSAGSENAYFGYIQPSTDAIGIHKYVAGISTSVGTASKTIDSGKWYFIRFRAQGTALKLKVWEQGAEEPAAWDIEAADPDLSSGWVGLGAAVQSTNDEALYDFFNITTDNSTALDPVDSGTGTFNRLHMVYNGTAERKMYFNGAAITDSGCTEKPEAGADLMCVGFSNSSANNNAMNGTLEFFYLRPGTLPDDWISAEAAILEDPDSYYIVGSGQGAA